jgi:hypothetical protein
MKIKNFVYLLMIVQTACNAQSKQDVLDSEFKSFSSQKHQFMSSKNILIFGDMVDSKGDSLRVWRPIEINQFRYDGDLDSLLLKCYNIFYTQSKMNSRYERRSSIGFDDEARNRYVFEFYERPTIAPGKVSIKMSILNPKGILSQKWDVEWDRSDLSAYVQKYYRAPNELR